MTKSRNKGITLLALVITIIILLILAGISISALTNQGLFKNAKIAQNATEKAEVEQGKTLNEYEDEINKYLSNNDKTGERLVDKVNDGTIKIGDYVKYTPNTASTDSILQELNTYSGSDKNTTSTLTQESLNWRVLDIKDGQVRLISELPTTSTITLSSYNGYNNAVKLLDDTCNVLYNNSKIASKVQNIKIEDITKHMTTQPIEDTTVYNPTNIKYPEILKQEENQTVINSTADNKLDKSSQDGFITGNNTSATSTLRNTYWNKTMTTNDFKDNKYYELFINNVSNDSTYWMSSRCVIANSKNVGFLVRYVHSADVIARNFYDSYGGESSLACAFRPIITLNSNVQIDTVNSGNGKTAEQGYAIK